MSGKHFLLNSEPIFLSGYGDDNIFRNDSDAFSICRAVRLANPKRITIAALSYAPPFDRAWYRKKFAFARSVGLLFVRYHSHVLPDEAYDEADRELHEHCLRTTYRSSRLRRSERQQHTCLK